MKLRVDNSRCTGHGRCYTHAPEVFAPDDEGFCDRRDQIRRIAPGHERDAEAGARACPEEAITILGD